MRVPPNRRLHDVRIRVTAIKLYIAFQILWYYYIIITILFSFLSHNVFVMSCGIVHT
jgi:hypothetical protein